MHIPKSWLNIIWCIVKINAKRALLGQLKGKPELVELSGYLAFKNQLTDFLDGISPDDVYDRLKHQLVEFLNTQVQVLGSQKGDTGLTKKFDKFLRQMVREKSGLSSDMAHEIERASGKSVVLPRAVLANAAKELL